MSARFDAAVFDMDGLLLDSERPIRDAWLDAAAQLGVALSGADYLDLVGRNERDGTARLHERTGDPHLYATLRRHADVLLAERFGTRPFGVKPGARRLLGRLRDAGIPCAVASSTARAEVERRLAATELLPHFRAVCGGDEVAHGKPRPDLYLLAASRLAIEPQRCLAFEDSNFGAQAAIAAALSVIVVPDLKPAEDPWRSACLRVLDSLEEADALAGEWFGLGG